MYDGLSGALGKRDILMVKPDKNYILGGIESQQKIDKNIWLCWMMINYFRKNLGGKKEDNNAGEGRDIILNRLIREDLTERVTLNKNLLMVREATWILNARKQRMRKTETLVAWGKTMPAVFEK